MGKSQKKRSMRRHNPVRVPDSHLQHGLAIAAASTPAGKREAVVPIMEKLASADVQERIWACAAVSNLIQNDSSTRRLLQGKNVVGILISRLGDDVDEVVIEAAGALRNLCIDGGYEICAEMFNKGILGPLATFVPKISAVLTQLFTNPKGSVESTRFVYDFAENTITLFWCLSETSNKALNAINQLHLIPFLMAFLDSKSREKLAITTVTAAAQCLYVLTEENDLAADEIRMNTTYINCLFGIARGDMKKAASPTKVNGQSDEATQRMAQIRQLSLKTLVCGILRNIQPLPSLIPASTIDIDQTVILPILIPLLSLDLVGTVTNAQSLLSQQENSRGTDQALLKNGAKSDHKSESERRLECIEAELRTTTLALEVITDICAELPEGQDDEGDSMVEEEDEEEEEEWEDDDDDDEEGERDEEMEMDEDAPVEMDVGPVIHPKSVDLVSSIVPACLAFIQPTVLSYPPPSQPSPHPPTTSALTAIHTAALECLNNLCLSVAQLSSNSINPTISQQIANVWPSVWSMLSTLGTPDYANPAGLVYHLKRKIWRISLSVLWAVARIQRDSSNLVPEEAIVRVLMEVCSSPAEEDEVKVMCLGIMECLAVNSAYVAANKPISEYILSFLPTNSTKINGVTHNASKEAVGQRKPGPDVVVQAASSIIDIFSDEQAPWDVNFRQGSWEKVLKSSLEGVRKAVRSIDTRKEGGKAARARGDEVVLNLAAFIKYRRALRF